MNFKALLLCFFLSIGITFAQEAETINTEYRAEREKVSDLVHTKLKVDFDFKTSQMNGEAWITLTPHFYNVNELELDAKAMLIHKITSNGKDLKYEYDGNKLQIKLGNTYGKGEEYEVYIKYTARPEEVTQQGSAAITSAKGLYFIDPLEEDPEKPTQIWTQGETEASSCWFPTIDSPNQKTSQEIYMTVPNQYVTLSNGLLKEQTSNTDGTRTDYWKFDQKHAPYLFFMGVGEFSVVQDKWKNLDVDYYVEKDYESVARGIFGLTPEMMDFYSDYTGVEYPWPKYAQMVGRDYVSGAMENTTAVLHGEMAYQTAGELVDDNTWEATIAHELFHHWFGDLVTAESWSNLTINESFANYSEYLWLEHKYGRDHADAHRLKDVKGYLTPGNDLKDLVRFHYNSREDMFDAVSYNKGGSILHMLRSYLGDEAFKAGMNQFLNDNMYGTGEAHQLRLAFEEVSGKDLNWFFNQWYFGNGHPKLDVNYVYSEDAKIVTVQIEQTQENIFEFPLAIEVFEEDSPKRYEVWVDQKTNSFSFKYENMPKLVNVDADRTLLAEFNDEKSVENLVHLYKVGKNYADRKEALEKLIAHQENEAAFETYKSALNDPYYGLRILAIKNIDLEVNGAKKAIKSIEELAGNDPKTLVRAAAIDKLFILDGGAYVDLYRVGLKSESSAVKGSSLTSLYWEDKEAALAYAGSISDKMEKESLKEALIPVFIMDKTESEMPFVADNIIAGMFFTQDKEKADTYKDGFQWIAASSNEEATQNLVDSFVQVGNQYKQYGADKMARQVLQQVLALKSESDYENKETLVNIVEDGISRIN
ncbi:M1 family metallopeptidase [Lutimonas zeaxanthinifaciens]|uniref:M1 family metallopeptidase n=1 Tax=Lutimonas zeaxanthinifaciens TaxID=3060215 RepID=UPI00265D1843|nr:M1 family aminopeptidase [Lutimonas sp. YSD2104]WKK64561.1 M1 family aminopeptidase [Lutimonas sp. YSD2104]